MNDRERLSAWIDAQNKTVTELAEEMGVRRTYLSAIKGGSRNHGLAFVERFRRAFGNEAADAIFTDEMTETV